MSEICFNFELLICLPKLVLVRKKCLAVYVEDVVRYLLGECNDLHGGLEVVFRHHYMVGRLKDLKSV